MKPAAAVARSTPRSRISPAISEASSSDSMYCGHTALTRMLSRATASATDLVIAMHGGIGDAGRKAIGMRMARRLPDDVDDAAVALALHDRQHRLDHGEEAEHLVAQLPLQDRQRRALDRSAQVSAGVVDQNVDAAECLKRGVDEFAHGRFVGHVGRNTDHRRADFREVARPPRPGARRRARRSRPRSLPAAEIVRRPCRSRATHR